METKSQIKAFALYRLPHSAEIRLVREEEQPVLSLDKISRLDGIEGFVLAPFHITAEKPVVVIQGRHQTYVSGQTVLPECHFGTPTESEHEGKESYERDFCRFHNALSQGRFGKLVLARRCKVPGKGPISPESLFLDACQRYPRMMIALVSSAQSGTWLMATPETLLRGDGKTWHTMALAGTMKLSEQELQSFDCPIGNPGKQPQWSAKNRAEQQLVADYLARRLEMHSDNIMQQPTHTVRAGNLVHLRSDFTFTLPSTDKLGTLLESLHPTPAVCGLPKEEARNFILENESAPREYYSGFMGPLCMEGETHLYVALRCMRLFPQCHVLYAGGGLLPESTAENEWRETEQKMETMRLCIAASQT